MANECPENAVERDLDNIVGLYKPIPSREPPKRMRKFMPLLPEELESGLGDRRIGRGNILKDKRLDYMNTL